MSEVKRSLRYLRRNLGFASAAVLVLSIGLASNIVIFTLTNTVLLRPLPYAHSSRLLVVREVITEMRHLYPSLPANPAHFASWRAQSSSFQELCALLPATSTLTSSGGAPEQIGAARVSANLFQMLEVRPFLGQSFNQENEYKGQDQVVILTYELWRREFNGDPNVIGKAITVDGEMDTVLGVLPKSFYLPATRQLGSLVQGADRIQIFRPLSLDSSQLPLIGNFDYIVIGQLKPGIDPKRAEAELNTIQAKIAREIPEKMELKATVVPMQDLVVGAARKPLLFLQFVVLTILIIICVNLTSLFLARNASRRQEFAIRAALGGRGLQVAYGMLVETAILATAGGVLGAVLAATCLKLFVIHAKLDLPRMSQVHFDGRVLGFTILVSLVACGLCAFLPMWQVVTSPLSGLPKGGHGATHEKPGVRLRNVLVSIEVALTSLVLITAGLFLFSLLKLLHIDAGFDSDNVVAARLVMPPDRYLNPEARNRFFDQVLASVLTIGGVRSAGLVSTLPLQGESWVDVVTTDMSQPIAQRPLANYRVISPGYLETMAIPLREGRMIEAADRNQRSVLISERTANAIWPHEDPIGKQFRRGHDEEAPYQVVGVVGDTRSINLEQNPGLMVYMPYWLQDRSKSSLSPALVLRTNRDVAQMAPEIRRQVWNIDSLVPVEDFRMMDGVVSESLATRRFQTTLVILFGAIGLVLAIVGIYGMISFSIAQRSRELGIRAALGATPGRLFVFVTRQGMMFIFAGLLGGFIASESVASLLNSFLFGLTARNPLIVGGVLLVVFVVSLMACLWPARRVFSVQPMTVLRTE
jgi:predicted permease